MAFLTRFPGCAFAATGPETHCEKHCLVMSISKDAVLGRNLAVAGTGRMDQCSSGTGAGCATLYTHYIQTRPPALYGSYFELPGVAGGVKHILGLL